MPLESVADVDELAAAVAWRGAAKKDEVPPPLGELERDPPSPACITAFALPDFSGAEALNEDTAESDMGSC